MKIQLSGNLLRFSGFQHRFELTATTVNEGIERLIALCPDLKNVLLDGDGQLRQVHLVALNGAKIDDINEAVNDDDELLIATAIAGG